MKPGKPLTFATIPASSSGKAMVVFGLPGNPVSSIVTYNLVCLPALQRLSGNQVPACTSHPKYPPRLKLCPPRNALVTSCSLKASQAKLLLLSPEISEPEQR